MKKSITIIAVALAAVTIMAASAAAHFQMIYTPNSALTKAKKLTLKMVFTHPFSAGHTMNMGQPEQFFVVHKKKKKNLMGLLKPITFKSNQNAGRAYEATYRVRAGDYIFVLVPAPYYEASEKSYIQQWTKVYVNVAGISTDWDRPVGLAYEILPLVKPYAIWTGSNFRGVVLFKGKPVPYAEIEVEYLNHPPVMGQNKFRKKGNYSAPQDSFETLTIKADANGVFSFGIPKAGWWGFAALDLDENASYKGKHVSRDAVIWVQAVDMK
jgi:cobalt/nickel transport protein